MKKLYISFTALMLCISSAHSEIVYRNFPDGSFPLDIDSNGVNEFANNAFIGDDLWSPNGASIIVWGNQTKGWDEADALTMGEQIDSTSNWAIGDINVPDLQQPSMFPDSVDVYLGVKFKIAGKTHYGWIRVNITNPGKQNMTIVYKDLAYENTPNAAITAGDAGFTTSLNETKGTSISVFPNPASGLITINTGNDIFRSVAIYALDGKLILNKSISSFSEKINVDGLENGIYMMILNSNENGSFTQKLIINH